MYKKGLGLELFPSGESGRNLICKYPHFYGDVIVYVEYEFDLRTVICRQARLVQLKTCNSEAMKVCSCDK